MSQYLATKEVGDKVKFEGPLGKMIYLGNGNFVVMKKPLASPKTKIGLIAGGSGITPLYSLANAIHLSNDQACEVKLLYSNKTRADILIRDELARLD